MLYYSISDAYAWNRPYLPHNPDYVDKFYRYTEPGRGRRYRLGDLTNPNRDRPNLTYEWERTYQSLALDERTNAGGARQRVGSLLINRLGQPEALSGRDARRAGGYDMG